MDLPAGTKCYGVKTKRLIQQTLIRKFGFGKKRKEKLWVLDKRTGKVYQSSARDVGHENKFYQYISDDDILDPEALFEDVESYTAPILAKINKTERLCRTPNELTALSYFLSTQMLRSPSVRNDMENLRQLMVHKWGPDIKVHPDDPKTIGEYGPDDAKLSSLNALSDVPGFANLLKEKVWLLCEAPHSDPFIISDNPVNKHNMIERKGRGNLGIKNDGIEIYLPISPRFTLQALCPKMSLMAATSTPEISERYNTALNNGTAVLYKPENVEFLNSQQVIWAERFVYARSKKHLEMPIDMLRTNPELKDGPGNRQRKDEI